VFQAALSHDGQKHFTNHITLLGRFLSSLSAHAARLIQMGNAKTGFFQWKKERMISYKQKPRKPHLKEL